MATVGEQLKAAREAQRLTVTRVANLTKIRSDHIRAIDAGNYDIFSEPPVYIRGFVRTYAMALKLDPAVILSQLNLELAEAGCSARPSNLPHRAFWTPPCSMFPTAGRRMILPAAAGAMLLCVAAVGWLVWSHYQNRNPLTRPWPRIVSAASRRGGNPSGCRLPAARGARPSMTTPGQRPVRVGLISLGCAKNLVDAEIMLGSLLKDGMEITNDAAQADVVIVNTCSFIDSAQEESVDAILRIRRSARRDQTAARAWSFPAACRSVFATNCPSCCRKWTPSWASTRWRRSPTSSSRRWPRRARKTRAKPAKAQSKVAGARGNPRDRSSHRIAESGSRHGQPASPKPDHARRTAHPGQPARPATFPISPRRAFA